MISVAIRCCVFRSLVRSEAPDSVLRLFPWDAGLHQDRPEGENEHVAAALHPREPDRILYRTEHASERPDVREDQAVEEVQGPPARAGL